MITAETVEARKEALEKILPYQRSDFKELFKAMEIYPVTIRFLDPPYMNSYLIQMKKLDL